MVSVSVFELESDEIDEVQGAAGPLGAAAGATIGFGYSIMQGLPPGQIAYNTALGAATGFVAGATFTTAAASYAAKVGAGAVTALLREQ